MGQLQVKSPYYTESAGQAADQKSSVCELPDGRTAFLVLDIHRGVTMPSRVHVYITNAAKTAIAAVYYFDYSNNTTTTTYKWAGRASMCVDVGGNLHVAYAWYEGTSGLHSLRYRKLTYSAGTGTFTVGGEQIVNTYVTNRVLVAIDIDIPSSSQNYPVIAVVARDGTSSANHVCRVIVYNRNNASWPYIVLRQVIRSYTYPDLSIACNQDADASTNFNMVIAFGQGPGVSGQADTGDYVWALRAAVGGAIASGSNVQLYAGLHKNYNGGYRAWNVFYLSNDTFMLYCMVRSAPSLVWHVLVTTSKTTNTWSQATTPRAVAPPNAQWARFTRKPASATLVRSLANPTTQGTFISWQVTTAGVWALTHEWAREGTTWKVTETKTYALWSRGYTVASTFLQPWGGDRGRTPSTESINVMTGHGQMNTKTVVKKVFDWKRPSRANRDVANPAENAIVPTNTPDVTLDVTGVGVDSAAIRQRMRIQVSTSSTFASNVYTVDQPLSAEAYYGTTKTQVKLSLANYPLTQGVWYIRTQAIDQFGSATAYSATRTFTVSHPPSATNLSPADSSVLVYNLLGSAFSWKFTDSYAKDVQTAYQIDIYDTETQTLVVSTGKIASSAQSASVVIPGTSLEKNLDWQVTVWDGDDVSSAPIDGGTVFLTQPPAPTITYPELDGDDIPTAMPAISWTPGISGTKTQFAYRIQIRGEDDTLLYDTRVVQSADNSYTVPAGILRNGNRYKVTLTVTDTTALDTTVSRLFDAVWPVPATMPRPTAYLDMYDTAGYASVIVSTAGWDEDLVKFHLYRRSMELNAPWELIHEIATLSDFIVFKDYFLPAGVTSEYALTQLVDRFGDLIESSLALAPKFQINPANAHYWLVDKTDPEMSIKLQGVTGDSYQPELEEASYTVVGRGRQFEVGEDIGIAGTLNAKLRDQNSNGFYRENYNLLGNPNFEDDALGVPAGWSVAITSGSADYTLDSISQPSGPTNRRSGRLRLTAAKTATTSGTLMLSVMRNIAKSSYFSLVAGSQYFMSVWISIPAPVVGYTARLVIDWREGAAIRGTDTVQISTDTTTVTSAQVLETRYINGTLWYRIGKVTTAPSGWNLDSANFRVALYSTASGTATAPQVNMDIEGGTLTLGTDPVGYFSGDEPSGEWTGVEKVDPSFTPGCYTARKQRQSLIQVQKDRHELYLRNPFGDVWPVHVSNLQIEREAGMASSEGVGVEIPYFELRES